MKTFLVLFLLAILIVVGSASAMRYLGNKHIPKRDIHDDTKKD